MSEAIDHEEEAMDAWREYDARRRVQGQKALAWQRDGYPRILAVHGDVLSKDEEPTDLFEFNNQAASGDGLWLWEGWAYFTEGSYEYPDDRELIIGGEFRRLTTEEAQRLADGGDVFAVRLGAGEGGEE